MNKLSPEQIALKRSELVKKGIGIILDRGWEALTNRNLERFTKIDRSTISTLLPAKDEARKCLFISEAFIRMRFVASNEGRNGRANIGVIQSSLLDLFRNSRAPGLMNRVCAFASLPDEVGDHFSSERAETVRHFQENCSSQPHKVERLVDWYIAACAVFAANSSIRIEELSHIGRLLGDDPTAFQ